MECPRCHGRARVLESRAAAHGTALRRRRECSRCGHRFTTFERIAAEPLHVVKRDGSRQRFDRGKLRAALLRATHKRQVGPDEVESIVSGVEAAIATAGGALAAERIGELCLEGLRDLDEGAYLQFLGTLPTPAAAGFRPDFAESSSAGSVR